MRSRLLLAALLMFFVAIGLAWWMRDSEPTPVESPSAAPPTATRTIFHEAKATPDPRPAPRPRSDEAENQARQILGDVASRYLIPCPAALFPEGVEAPGEFARTDTTVTLETWEPSGRLRLRHEDDAPDDAWQFIAYTFEPLSCRGVAPPPELSFDLSHLVGMEFLTMNGPGCTDDNVYPDASGLTDVGVFEGEECDLSITMPDEVMYVGTVQQAATGGFDAMGRIGGLPGTALSELKINLDAVTGIQSKTEQRWFDALDDPRHSPESRAALEEWMRMKFAKTDENTLEMFDVMKSLEDGTLEAELELNRSGSPSPP